jgi:large subunit ribosomal protein L6
MSRIGNKAIPVPGNVKVDVKGVHITVQGPKGALERDLHPLVAVTVESGQVIVARKGDERLARSMHGMTRTLVSNMIAGVLEPFKKSLEITGVGYRAELKGALLNLQVGLSHEVNHPIPKSVSCTVEKQTMIHLSSPDKELLGQVAAQIRAYRPTEPYKGKGIKYVGERVLRKEGKTKA